MVEEKTDHRLIKQSIERVTISVAPWHEDLIQLQECLIRTNILKIRIIIQASGRCKVIRVALAIALPQLQGHLNCFGYRKAKHYQALLSPETWNDFFSAT